MKKIALALAALAFSASAFAEGFSIGGYIRGGVADSTKDSVLDTTNWLPGDYFGGGTRLRVNVDYEKENGGITFRYQSDLKDFFGKGTIKYAMAYVNFFDGKLAVEGGLLTDRFTTSGGWEDTSFDDGGTGLRLVVKPIEGLTLTAQASDVFAGEKDVDGKTVKKFDADICAFTAAYDTDAFFVRGGAALAGMYYGSFGFTGVEGLTTVVEAIYDSTDATKTDNNDNAVTTLVFWAEYTGVEKLLLGVDAYFNICDGNTDITINPAVSYDFTDAISASLDATINLPNEGDALTTITPAVTFKASDKASVNVFGTISTDTDQEPHTVGAGVKYAF